MEAFDGMLRGWLKIPKGGKIRKGWVDRYFVVRDYKLFIFEREKDAEFFEGVIVAEFA